MEHKSAVRPLTMKIEQLSDCIFGNAVYFILSFLTKYVKIKR